MDAKSFFDEPTAPASAASVGAPPAPASPTTPAAPSSAASFFDAPAAPSAPGFFSNVGAGFARGAEGVSESLHVAAPVAMYQLGMGDEDSVANAIAPIRAQEAKQNQGLAPVAEAGWTNPAWWEQQLGGLVPNVASSVIGGAIGGFAGSAAGPVGSTVGTLVGLGSAGAMQANGVSFADYLAEHGVDVTNAAAISTALRADPALAQSAKLYAAKRSGMDAIVNMIMGGAGGAVESAGLKGPLKLLAETGIGAGASAGSEAASEYLDTGTVDPSRVALGAAAGAASGLPIVAYGGLKLGAKMGARALRGETPPPLPDVFVHDPTTGKLVPNPELPQRDMSDPENAAMSHIWSAIHSFGSPGKTATEPGNWRGHIFANVPISVWDNTQTGQHFLTILDEIDPKQIYGPQAISSLLAQSDIQIHERTHVGMGANKNLEPDVRITNPSHTVPINDLKISTGNVANRKGQVLIVDSASRAIEPSEAAWLARYANERGLDFIAWRGDVLDGAFHEFGIKEVKPNFGGAVKLKLVKPKKDAVHMDYWTKLATLNARSPVGAKPRLLALTGDGRVDAILTAPEVRRAIESYDPRTHINRNDDVPLLAGASMNSDVTHIHRKMPQEFTTKSGKKYSPDYYLHVHEQVEKYAMEKLGMNYHDAHYEIAIPAERAALEADGINPNEYNVHVSGSYGGFKDESPVRTPEDLYRGPYRDVGKEHLLVGGGEAAPQGDFGAAAKPPSGATPKPKRSAFRPSFGESGRWTEAQLDTVVAKMQETIQSIAKSIGISKPIKMHINKSPKVEWHGLASDQAGEYHIHVNPPLIKTFGQMYEVMAHELGHIIAYDRLKEADPRTAIALLDAWHRWRDEVATMANKARQRGEDPLDAITYTRSGAMDYLADRGSRPDPFALALKSPLAKKYNSYWHSYSEWFAQQAARWATSQLKPLSVVDRFFKGLGGTIYRAVSRIYRSTGMSFDPDPVMKSYFNHLARDIDAGAFKSIYEKIAIKSRLANMRAMIASGNHTDATTISPSTGPMREAQIHLFQGVASQSWKRVFDTAKANDQQYGVKKGDQISVGVARYWGNIAAVGDVINKFYSYAYNLPQLALANAHIQELTDYKDTIQQAEQEKIRDFGINEGTKYLRSIRHIGPAQMKELHLAWDAMDRMTYRSQAEADNGIRRHPTPAERDKITAKLDDRTKAAFEGLFDHVDKQLEGWADVMREDIAKKGSLPDQAAKLRDLDEAMRRVREVPAVPHLRWGKYSIRVLDSRGNPVHFETTESKRVQTRRMKELSDQYDSKLFQLRKGILSEDSRPFFSIPPLMLKLVEEKLGHTMSTSQLAAIKDLQQQFGPAASKGTRLARHDIPGYSKDFIRAFADYTLHSANYLSRVKYRDKLQGLIDTVSEQAKFFPDGAKRMSIRNYMADHFAHWVDPKPDHWQYKSAAFFIFHGYNPKSMIVNFTQIPMQTYPFLASHFGHNEAVTTLLRNMGNHMTYMRKASLDKGGFSDPKLRALAEGVREGRITEALAPELAGQAENRNLVNHFLGSAAQRAWTSFMTHSTDFFQASEHLNRKLTFTSAYDLAMQHPSNKGVGESIVANPSQYERLIGRGFSEPEARAITYALHSVEITQGTYARWARPRMFRGKLGTLFMFKSFQQQFMFMNWNYPQAAVRSLLITGALGGLMGEPLVADAVDALKAIGYMVFGKDFDLERETRQFLVDIAKGEIPPDLVVHGLSTRSFGIPALLDIAGNTAGLGDIPFPNTDLSASTGVGQLSPVPLAPLFGPVKDVNAAIGDATQHFAGAAYGLGFSLYKLITDPTNMGSWNTLVPRAAYNVIRAYEAYNDNLRGVSGARTIRFDPHDTTDMMEALAYGMGFRPTRLTEAQARNQAIREVETYWQLRREGLLRQYATAGVEKDPESKSRVISAIKNYNHTVPVEAGLERITGKELEATLKARVKQVTSQEKGLGGQTGKRVQPLARGVRQLYPLAAPQTPAPVPGAKEISRAPVSPDLRVKQFFDQ